MRCCLILSLIFSFAASTNAADKAADKNKWTVDDVLMTESALDFQISPDGNWAVWVKSAMNKEKGEALSHLMRTDLKEHTDLELTRGDDSCTGPRWSPDGKRIAFNTDRTAPKTEKNVKRSPTKRRASDKDESKQQIWLIDPFGGEAWRLTDVKRGISSFDWAGSDQIVFVAQEEESYYDQKIKEDKDTSNVVDDEKHEPPSRLFRIDVKTKKITRLTENTDRIDYATVSPDGKWAVARHSRSLSYAYDNRIKPLFFLHNLADGSSKPIFTDKKLNISSARWTHDCKGFYASNEFNSKPEFASPSITELYFFDVAANSARPVDLGWPNGLANQDANDASAAFLITPDGFLALLANGTRHKFAKFTRNGDLWQRDWIEGEHASNIFGLAVSQDGKSLVYAHTTASKMIAWHHAALDKKLIAKSTAIAARNESLSEKSYAKSEVIRWKGGQDEEVEGILYYPRDYTKGKKYPLVVMIHGGPNGADFDAFEETWAYPANLYSQRGAFVLKPNYHGSSNFGLKWLESIAHGKYYDLEIPDIEKGVDHLIDKGFVDKDKLGVLGWSNGAILAIELLTRTTRYKCAATGAGDVDWISDWANCDFGDSFDRFYLGKSPFEDPQLYIKKSPFYRLDKVRTPTLIFFGTEDRNVATEQGWMHYRALQQHGKTDVRFILFPGEKHGPKKLVHQKRKVEEELAWFDKHLFKTAKNENEALKEDSPLAQAIKLQSAKRAKGLFGTLVQDKLIPEVVKHGDTLVGRFEVTRAQFQAFDPTYSIDKGTENYPASGLSFEQAKAYCVWLSKLTGHTYRLPDEDEADDLYADEDNANTLDHWAGYKVNPDDARKLRDKIAALGKTSLLKEVGQFKPAGEGDDSIFDLGGNVAEWTTTKDGKGKLKGGSADQPADEKTRESIATEEYRGFRVVREEKKE